MIRRFLLLPLSIMLLAALTAGCDDTRKVTRETPAVAASAAPPRSKVSLIGRPAAARFPSRQGRNRPGHFSGSGSGAGPVLRPNALPSRWIA